MHGIKKVKNCLLPHSLGSILYYLLINLYSTTLRWVLVTISIHRFKDKETEAQGY